MIRQTTLSIILLFTIISIGYSQTKPPLNKDIQSFDEHNPALDKNTYFPKDKMDNDRNTWYSPYLYAMKEPILYKISDNNIEIYRFTWLRSFHKPVCIRVIKSNNIMKIYIKVLSNERGFKPAKLIVSSQSNLTTSEWAKIIYHTKKSNFWNYKPEDPFENEDNLDGAQWIMEGLRKGHYHLLDNWSPKKGAYRDMCLYFLKLSKLKIKKIY